MILRRLQQLLGGIYDVDVSYDVYDFLVTDRRALPACARTAPSDEQLIVATQPGDEVGLSLYLDPGVLERLQGADPLRALHQGNVGDCWTALEGVSHFLYFVWNAGHDKSVSLLELELQAEIDKYVVSCFLLREQCPERFPLELMRVLFERTRIDRELAAGREHIYRSASHYAERFCRRLEGSLRTRDGHAEHQVLAELRRFYRLTDARKRALIEQH